MPAAHGLALPAAPELVWGHLPRRPRNVSVGSACFLVAHRYELHDGAGCLVLVDYPSAARLYPGALDAPEKSPCWGRTAIVTDADTRLPAPQRPIGPASSAA